MFLDTSVDNLAEGLFTNLILLDIVFAFNYYLVLVLAGKANFKVKLVSLGTLSKAKVLRDRTVKDKEANGCVNHTCDGFAVPFTCSANTDR